MFWGLIMEPHKRYSQTVKRSFHISMAALDICESTDAPVQVMCGFEDRKYLLCTLQKDSIVQCPLDLNFDVGDQVSFVINGGSHVHLSGYINDEFDDQFGAEEEEEEEEIDETAIEQLGNVSASNIVTGKRPKKEKKNSSPNGQPPAKKTKLMKLLDEVNSQDESDDSDVQLSDLIGEEEEDEDETTFVEDDEDGEDDDEEDGEDDDEDIEEEEDDELLEEEEDEEDDDEEAEEEESEEEEIMAKPKMNGVAKKSQASKDKKDSQTKQKSNEQKKKGEKENQKPQEKSQKPERKTIEGGVIIEDLKVGSGQAAKSGKVVQVFYEGRLKNNNKLFDACTKGNGMKFRLGKQEVIKGWDVGVQGMKVGGKRRIICPPNMAYGPKGSPPVIPGNSTLVFEVELKKVH